jgi:hypothetical protein
VWNDSGALRRLLIAAGVLVPREELPLGTRFRNLAGLPILQVDHATRRALRVDHDAWMKRHFPNPERSK